MQAIANWYFGRPARHGAALLDRHMPDWYTRVDVDKLNIHSGFECVLAQTYGWDEGKEKLGLNYSTVGRYGFIPTSRTDILTRAWKQEIASRLRQDHATA